jgi:Lar family restriction alleviation protein
MKEVIEVLNKVHDFLGILIRENLIKEAPYLDEEPMLKVSDLADDLWEVIHKGPKPCPFCGGEAMERKSNKLYYVFCKNCSVKTVDSITKDAAIEAWNRRVS